MTRITPLMTALHDGHKAEERLQYIDDMLVKCEDTKFTVLKAFWWYRKYTKAKLQKLEKIEQIVNGYNNWKIDGDELAIKVRTILEQE